MKWVIWKSCEGYYVIAPCHCVHGPFDYHWQAKQFIERRVPA